MGLSMMPVLIVDPDPKFLETLRNDPQANILPPVLAQTGYEAERLLNATDRMFSGIFINPVVQDPDGLNVIRFAHLKKAGTPIYLIRDDEDFEIKDEFLERLAIQEVIRKPVSYEQILKLITPIVEGFDADAALRQSQKNADHLGEETDASDSRFIPILSHNFLSGRKNFFNVYVRLSSGRYVKILNAGDTFSPERLSMYLKKGVDTFYLHKEMQATYLAYCDHLSSSLIKMKNAPIGVKANQALNMGQETLSYLMKQGLSKNNVTYAIRFTKTLNELVRQPEFVDHSRINEFLLDLSSYEHGVATSMISSMIIRHDNIGSDRVKKIVSLASLFHDVGMQGALPVDCESNVEKLDTIQFEIYEQHPLLGFDILRQIKGLDPVVPVIVAQHHERRSGAGFPRRLALSNILWFTDVVAISDEFAKLISQVSKNTKIKPLEIMVEKIFQSFSLPVVEMFRKAFNL